MVGVRAQTGWQEAEIYYFAYLYKLFFNNYILPGTYPIHPANTVVVLDFETTGLSPNLGDRAIEIGAVLIEDGVVKDRFQELMNPGFWISGFIESYTGITNQMLADARSCEEVMADFADFIGDHNLVAHNASFDSRFLKAKLGYIGLDYAGAFACSMLVARRIFQHAPDHKLGSLIRYANIPHHGVFHRALADSEMTVKLWMAMIENLETIYGIRDVSFQLMQKLARQPKKKVSQFLQSVNG
ncbi:MAG: 3'-5' exonuclease [Bacteroidetes bacterium]|nr:3'-5' exonuclease [Bacteroidota bacterium]